MSADKVVLVTGVSGYVGSHIVYALLEAGYSVRGTVRGHKLDNVKKVYQDVKAFKAIEISDLIHGQFPEAFEGVYAVVHVATPLAGRVPAEELFDITTEGSLNVLRQAERAGVKKIVYTATLAAALTPAYTFTDQGNANDIHPDWHPMTKEQALVSTDQFSIYASAKAHAEKAVWEWAEKNPHIEVATVGPSFVYGPFTPYFLLPDAPDYDAISTNLIVYNWLKPGGSFLKSPMYVDVRDVARAHVAALDAPPTSEAGRKRILFSSPLNFTYEDVLNLIKDKRPELKDRIIAKAAPTFPFKRAPINYSRIEQLTGMKEDDFHTFEETILDTIDALVALEGKWKAQGHAINIPGFPVD
ncbi:hypothetical protein AX16_006951 [Volvariella volvacea WC 439]|nr:hypothetical protein AX16_006951 [Volvariella volvacea WC 439]